MLYRCAELVQVLYNCVGLFILIFSFGFCWIQGIMGEWILRLKLIGAIMLFIYLFIYFTHANLKHVGTPDPNNLGLGRAPNPSNVDLAGAPDRPARLGLPNSCLGLASHMVARPKQTYLHYCKQIITKI